MPIEELKKIEEEIKKCRRCPLYQGKINYVPGEGDPSLKIMFIGEAPGREEDKQGRPFVGKAGQLLTRLIEEKLGIKREKVFITNVLKCRPPNNRDPKEEEIRACSYWLEKQIEIIKPNIIICLGRFSAKWIFNYFKLKYSSLSKVRGKVYTVNKWGKTVKIFPTYHPAAALYHGKLLNALEEDFESLSELIERKESKRKTLLDYF